MSHCSRIARAALAVAVLPLALPLSAQQPGAPAAPAGSIATRTAGFEKRDGFLSVYLDDKTGKVYLEIPRDSLRLLHFVNQATGLGSNPVGIDRGGGQMDNLARFERLADRVLLVYENTKYRSSGTGDHARTVRESFPPSVVAALPLVAEEGGRLLVDATDFALRDWLDIAGALQQANEGAYLVARDRSGVYKASTRAFPDNTEIDVSLAFVAQGRPGNIVSQVAPDGRAVALRVHHSFVRLPDDGFRPREADPRVGFFGVRFKDYARPLQQGLDVTWISKHRLERVNPNDTRSPLRKPITYYVDRGIPEPVRTASLEGARFWVEAFDRAGLVGGFRVELLPEGVDPMDARYNVVQWVNRNERGWSIGGSVGDPRTGEIVKAMARMDSHRARTDYNLYAGLMGADAAAADTAFVLARVRQVTAHEIGHTLGLAHNYIASTNERMSVMDYPPPRVRLDAQGRIDIARAYATGPGAFDVWSIHWGYGAFPPATEADSLRAIMAEGLRNGYLFLSDADARPEFASDPRVSLWDDAATPEEFLKHQADVRRVAMRQFGLRNIRAGEPVATLQERFAPVYFMHRFALNGVSKAVGGMEYHHAISGDGQQATRPVPAARQRAALALLIGALAPAELAIPDSVVTLLGPRPFGYEGSVELFRSRTFPAFDEFGAARTLAQMVVDGALQSWRAGRLAQQSARDATQLSLPEVIDNLVDATWNAPAPAGPRKFVQLQRVTQRTVMERVLTLAADLNAGSGVRAIADYKLGTMRTVAESRARAAGVGADRGGTAAHWQAIAADIARWQERRELPPLTRPLAPPPGDPFGLEP
ncbi:MAG: zinc-dependent metalloprotease [Gemmatimonadetes bacterium]|nr:zinc-dependent metalloprotease [Gemmatimonadota bacterium]